MKNIRRLDKLIDELAKGKALERFYVDDHMVFKVMDLAMQLTLSADGRFFIDKRYRGIRIGIRVGPVTQDQAQLPGFQHNSMVCRSNPVFSALGPTRISTSPASNKGCRSGPR